MYAPRRKVLSLLSDGRRRLMTTIFNDSGVPQKTTCYALSWLRAVGWVKCDIKLRLYSITEAGRAALASAEQKNRIIDAVLQPKGEPSKAEG